MIQIERTVSATSTKLTARSLSCSSTSTNRKQNRTEFAKYYTDLCHVQHSHPLNAIKQNLDKGILDFYCDRIKFDEWWSIINALGSDKSLHLIAIRSRHPQKHAIESADTELKARAIVKQPVFATRFVLLWLMESIKLCLSQSPSLSVLELEGLPLAGDYLVSLSSGLVETTSLQHLSFYKSKIGDDGAGIICHTIKNLPCIISLDLSYCDLTERGAEILSEMVKYQKLNRYSEAWKQTLRYRDPDVEAMPGLRRITINGNTEIGDRGVAVLADEIKDDLWLRALDVQDCGLTDEGGTTLIDLTENNRNLVIVDGRGNPFMSEEILTEIMNRLAVNNKDRSDSEYRWINKNLSLHKKNFQVSSLKPRPWSCHSSSRSTNRSFFPDSPTSRTATQLNKGNLPQDKVKKDEKNLENECLRMQLRDLTIALNQEVRHKLLLLEENKKLKELLDECQADKKKLEEVQGNKVLIAEDTLKVLEDTIKKFGTYISQRHQEEEEETSESTTARSTADEHEIPELVSNLTNFLKKAASTTDYNNRERNTSCKKHKERPKHSSSETQVSSIKSEKGRVTFDVQSGEKPEEILENLNYKNKLEWHRGRSTDQTIWEEDEISSNSSDTTPTTQHNENNKSKAQAMFMKIIEEGVKDKSRNEQYKGKHILSGRKYVDDDGEENEDSTSDISEYDMKRNDNAKQFASSTQDSSY